MLKPTRPDQVSPVNTLDGFGVMAISHATIQKSSIVIPHNFANGCKAGRYSAELRSLGLTPSDIPDWSPITFSAGEQWGPGTIARELAARGITEDEALDVHDFAFSWLSDVVATETDEETRDFIRNALSSSNAVATVDPWPPVLPFAYDEGLRRWMPILPVAGGATQHVASTVSDPDGTLSAVGASAPLQETPLEPTQSTPMVTDATPPVEPPDLGAATPLMEVDDSGAKVEGPASGP